MELGDPLSVTRTVAAVLEDLGLPYLVGGSLASSFHGVPRSTQDVDLVVDMNEQHVAPLVARLAARFYVDEAVVRGAVRRRASFNVIELETMLKVDVFVLGDDALSREEMRRRCAFAVGDASPQPLYFASAEDIVAHKLHWYRLGDGVSDRQWLDVLNVLRVQRGRLDLEYLRAVARARGAEDLLERALREASGDPPSG